MGLELASDWHPALAVLAILGLAALVYAAYFRNFHALPRRKGWLLLGLRIGVVLFLFLCILKPVISYQSIAGEKTRLVLLVDNSTSMTLPLDDARGRRKRIDVARDLVYGPDGVYGPLSGYFVVQSFAFAGSASQLPSDGRTALDAQGDSTAILKSLREAAAKSGATAPVAAVLVSDGADNSAAEAKDQGLGFPVFAVGVGSRLSEAGVVDLSVGAPKAPEQAYKNTTVQVEVEVRAFGLKNSTAIPVTLTGPEGEMLTASEVTLSGEKRSDTITLSFKPESTGVFEYSISVVELENELVKVNNRQSFNLHVLDSKLRVLLVDRARWEYKYLKMVLEQDPNISFTGAVLTQKNLFTLQGVGRAELVTRGLPADLQSYENWDVVILGDLSSEAFATDQLDALKRFVEGGGGFCALGGQEALAAGGYGGTPVEEILPVSLGGRASGQESGSFVMRVTDEGKRHPIMQGTASFFEGAGDAACELQGANATGRRKPGAMVLAEQPEVSVEGEPLVVVAVQRYGEGKTMIMTGATTYKWHLRHKGLGLDSPYVRFWGQAVRWLAGEKSSTGPLSLWTDRRNYLPGQTVHVKVRVDTDLVKQPLPETLPVQVETEKEVDTKHVRIQADKRTYEGEFSPKSGGRYKIMTSVTDREDKTVQESVEIVVGRSNLEFENADLNDEFLRRVAAESGGKYYSMHEAPKLLRDIRAIASAHSEEREVSIWDTPLFFLLFLGLATAEWVLRKRNMLV
jgi:uncharacterized membrane protein